MANYQMYISMRRFTLVFFINKAPKFNVACNGGQLHKDGCLGNSLIDPGKKEQAWTCKMWGVWYCKKWIVGFTTSNDKTKLTPQKIRVSKVEEFLIDRKLKEFKLRPRFTHVSLCCKLIPMTYEEALKYNVSRCQFKSIFNEWSEINVEDISKKRMTRSSFKRALGTISDIIFVCTRCKIGVCEKCMLAPNSKYVKSSLHHIHPLSYFRVSLFSINILDERMKFSRLFRR